MVTTTVHNTATPMDVDTQTMRIEMETSHGENEEYEDKPEEDHDSEQHGYQDEEGGPTCYVGKSSEGGWKTKGKPKEKGKFDGACYNCGKTGHRSRDCWSERSKGKGKDEQKGKGGYNKSEHGCNGGDNNCNSIYNHYNGSHKGGGKFVNAGDSKSFALQPQATYQNPGQGSRLMTTRWNGHV